MRPHFTSREAATSEAMVFIARLLRSGNLCAARLAIDAAVHDGNLTEFHELNFYALVEGIAASQGLDQLARWEANGDGDVPTIAQCKVEVADHQAAAAAYLEAALDAATTDHERTVIQENQASLALMRGDAQAAITILVAALRVEQSETLLANLLIALERAGATSDVDVVLDALGEACTPRLLRVLSENDSDLRDVKQRPAYLHFLAKASVRAAAAAAPC